MKVFAPFVLLVVGLAATIWMDNTPPDADIVFVNRSDVFTLDPQRMSYVQDFRMAFALYEGLVRWDNSDFTVVPALASDLPELSPDRRTYTFHLRQDARWSNGAPVTSRDFIYSWRRLLMPDTAADYSSLFWVIDGARDFWSWRTKQLNQCAANPWAEQPTPDPKTVRAMVDRLNILLQAGRLPPTFALPDLTQWSMMQSELRRLDDALKIGDIPVLNDALNGVFTVRRWYDRLNDNASRQAEAEWMWHNAKRTFSEMVGLRAPDDHTLIITLERPCPFFLDLCAFSVCWPVYRPSVEGWENDTPNKKPWRETDAPPFSQCRWVKLNPLTGRFEQKHQWARPGALISNGPYMLDRWRYKRDMSLVRNPFYHTREMAHADTIIARTINDTNTAVLAYESGHLDWLSDVNADYQADMLAERKAYLDHHRIDYDRLRTEGLSEDDALAQLPPPVSGERRNIHVFPTFGTDFYSFNCRPHLSDGRPNPFASSAVRRAFVLSIDKNIIVRDVTRLNEPVLTTFIPPDSIPGYHSPTGLPFDPDRARQELEKAGWSPRPSDGLLVNQKGELFPTIDLLWTTNNTRYKWISLELKSQWEEQLGVRVEMRGADTKFYKEDLKQGKFMIARGNWYGDYGDPTTFLDLCRSTDGNNDRKFNSPRIDALLDQAAAELDPDARLRILEECERILFTEEVPMLVICQLVQLYMYDPTRVKGLSHHPRLTQYLWQLEVQK